jgi:hypothetical protein
MSRRNSEEVSVMDPSLQNFSAGTFKHGEPKHSQSKHRVQIEHEIGSHLVNREPPHV